MPKPLYAIGAVSKTTKKPAGFVQLLPSSAFRTAGPKPVQQPIDIESVKKPERLPADPKAVHPANPNPSYKIVPDLRDATTMTLVELWCVIQINQGFGISDDYTFAAIAAGVQT